MTDDRECLACQNNSKPDLPARERIYLDQRWRVAHAFGTSLPGWLVVLPRRHILALDELTSAEAAGLGPLLHDLTAALRQVTGCVKTYLALFAESEGFGHLHVHVIPRLPSQPAEMRGPRVFACLSKDPAEQVSADAMDQLGTSLATALTQQQPRPR